MRFGCEIAELPKSSSISKYLAALLPPTITQDIEIDTISQVYEIIRVKSIYF